MNQFKNTRLEDLGVSVDRVRALLAKRIEAGAAEPDVSGRPLESIIRPEQEEQARESFAVVHRPTGDGPRVVVFVLDRGANEWDVCATTRGCYEDLAFTARVGRLDRDGLFQPTED